MQFALALALVLTPNLDDDDRDGLEDWYQPGFVDRDDDIIALKGLPAGTWLEVTGDAWAVRVRSGGEMVAGGDLPPWAVPSEVGPTWLDVGAFGVQAELRFTDPEGRVVLVRQVQGAPLILPHPLLPVVSVQVAKLDVAWDDGDNSALRRSLARWSPAPVEVWQTWSEGGRWLQDEYELAGAAGPWSRMEVVLRHWAWSAEGFVPWQDLLVGPGRAVVGADWRWETDADGFGNLEVTPPLPGYPQGRILYGVGMDGPPGSGILALLEAQGVQAPAPIDTSWLCVGHVDEIVSFVPDPTAPRGFRALVPDVKAGVALLLGLDPTTEIAGAPSRPAVAGAPMESHRSLEMLRADISAAALNVRIAEVHLPRLREQLRAIGIEPAEMIGLPVLYSDRASWQDEECGAIPVWPNPVNLLAVHDGERSVAFVPDPFFRPEGTPVDQDPVARSVAALLPPSLQAVWVDTWSAYHQHGGEVHCATNVRRAWGPSADREATSKP